MRPSRWWWHLDEVLGKINGERHHPCRAINHEGEVFEGLVTKDRAVRPVIAAAGVGEAAQGADDRLHLARLAFEASDLFCRETLHIRSLAGLVKPEGKKHFDLIDRKAQVAGSVDEAQHLCFGGGIDAVRPTAGIRPEVSW